MKFDRNTTNLSLLSTAALCLFAVNEVQGHGYLSLPISRNYYSNLHGLDWGTEAGVPMKENCHHCVNIKPVDSVCGISGQGVNYDEWVDSTQQPMPWDSNGSIHGEGDVITIKSVLTTHHGGHIVVRACPMGRASTQDCFDSNVLEFVEDTAYNMPKDENYPERGYFYGQATEFSMKFRLPEGLVGQEVLLQWMWTSANSCNPEGYPEYFNSHDVQPWNPGAPACTPSDFPPAFQPSPERFVNCAEITVVSTDTCEDDPTFKYKNKSKRNCEWVGKHKKSKKLCKKKKWEGKKISEHCPEACGEC